MRSASAASLVTHMPGIAEGAEILGRERTTGSQRAPKLPARRPLRIGRADRLRGILDEPQTVCAARSRIERIHVGDLAVQVHRHDGAYAHAAGAVHETRHRVARTAAR